MSGANIAIAVVGGVLTLLYDKHKEKKLARESLTHGKGAKKLEPRAFSHRQVAVFAQPAPGGRWMMFDPPVGSRIRDVLLRRSVRPAPIDMGNLGSFQAWEVVPYQASLPNAQVFLDQNFDFGRTVLGSHEMMFVDFMGHADPAQNKDAARILLVGGPELAMLAGPGGHFAELRRPVVVTVEASDTTPAQPPPPQTPSPEPAPVSPQPVTVPDMPAVPTTPEIVPGDEDTAVPLEAPEEPVVPASAVGADGGKKSNGKGEKAVLGSVMGTKTKNETPRA